MSAEVIFVQAGFILFMNKIYPVRFPYGLLLKIWTNGMSFQVLRINSHTVRKERKMNECFNKGEHQHENV